ncbi:MAG TPA: DUF262 domain-containing protein [Candidatus Acidoferrales bacterium]|jgi:hypothetical protein|nr:DUF262 domain-containing protein [Candidatus Acidoferrales bacterium]
MDKLIDLIRQLDTGDIALPIMQREYVWRPLKVERLLDSLYHGWPVGSFYLWRPSKKQPKKDHHLKKEVSGDPVRYLLDGQQRLASLSRAIKDEGNDTLLPPPGKGQSQAMSWRAFFDIANESFVLKGRKTSVERRIDANDPALLALSDVIQVDDHKGLRSMANISEMVRRLVEAGSVPDTDAAKDGVRIKLQRIKSMLDVDVLCHEIETSRLANTDSAEVVVAIEIFRRLNSGGTNLSGGDVAAAQLAQETTSSILGPMRDFARGRVCVALGLNFVFLTRALATIRSVTARFSKLPKSWATGTPPIEESWEKTRNALGTAIDLVLRMGWTTRRWLPSTNALLPVAYFAHLKGGNIPSHDEPEVLRFLCLAAWAGAFSKSSETAIDHYLRRLSKAGRSASAKVLTDAIPKSRLAKVQPEDVLAESKMAGPLMQIYLAYLVSRNTRSWPSGQLLADACKIADGSGSIDVHHIFPRKFVEHIECDFDVNTMGNYAILAQPDNASLADEDPKVAYGKLSADQKRLASQQFVPFGDEEILLPDAYAAFIKRRAKEMAKALNEFLGL